MNALVGLRVSQCGKDEMEEGLGHPRGAIDDLARRLQREYLYLPPDDFTDADAKLLEAVQAYPACVSVMDRVTKIMSANAPAHLQPLVRPAFHGNVMGGRGKCRYCGEAVNNVAYHESNACKHRPNAGAEARQARAEEVGQ